MVAVTNNDLAEHDVAVSGVTEPDFPAVTFATDEVDASLLAEDIARARESAIQAGFDFVDLEMFELDPTSADVLPEERSRRDRAVAVGWRYGLPVVAVATPENLFLLDDIYLAAGRDVHIVVASGMQIDRWIERVYANSPKHRAAGPTAPGSTRRPAAAAGPAELVPSGSDGIGDWVAAGLPVDAEGTGEKETTVGVDPVLVVDEGETPSSELDVLGAREVDLQVAETRDTEGEHSEAGGSVLSAIAAIELFEEPPDLVEPVDISGPKPALDQVLLESGAVSSADLEVALRQQQSSGRALREIIAELGIVGDVDLQLAVARVEGIEFVDLNNWTIDPAAAQLLPESLARRYRIIAIGFRGDRPIIAMVNPSDVFALDDVRTLLGREVVTVICTPQQVEDYLSRTYRHSDEANVAARTAALSAAASEATQFGELNDLHAVVEDAPIVKFVNLILRQALNERASDVHIEPSSDDLVVRFRIDGVLHHVTSAPKAIQGGVISRLKIMADLDIAEHRVPQDGRLSLTASGREIDLRVATLPTVHGEKVVLRVLDKSTAPLDLARLGFLPEVLARYEESYKKPSGTILVTGPTGSGKSTTLYATLNKLNLPERNLITVEDPVEYQLRGVNQVQVNPRAGLSFASALRSILRSDPDVILVGEIRDRETATIAIEAALTGHMVLTCLHTNDAASTPLRLIEMGVEPFLVCSALDCVLAQRLARQLCNICAEEYEPTQQELVAARWVEADTPESGALLFRRAIGCQACSGTGYHGRLAVQEVMPVTEEVERAILARASTEDIKRLAIFEGMTTLHRDGLRKAAIGQTSLEEILRVIV